MTGPDTGSSAPASPPETPVAGTGRRVPITRLFLGVLLVLIGAGWLLETLDVADIPWSAVLPVALMLVGLALALGSGSARHGGLVALGIVLVLVLTVTSSLNVSLTGGVGERRERPATAADLESEYHLAIGQLTVDLSGLDVPPGTTEIEVTLGIGELVVIVPEGAEFRVDYEVGAGEAAIEAGSVREARDGVGVDDRASSDGYASASERLSLTISLGLGSAKVREG